MKRLLQEIRPSTAMAIVFLASILPVPLSVFRVEGVASRFRVWHWIKPILGAFLQSSDAQQVHQVSTFF